MQIFKYKAAIMYCTYYKKKIKNLLGVPKPIKKNYDFQHFYRG